MNLCRGGAVSAEVCEACGEDGEINDETSRVAAGGVIPSPISLGCVERGGVVMSNMSHYFVALLSESRCSSVRGRLLPWVSCWCRRPRRAVVQAMVDRGQWKQQCLIVRWS